MLVNPFLKQTYTLLAPQRRAEVAQSNAVSPAPKTITAPLNSGRAERHWHMPGGTEAHSDAELPLDKLTNVPLRTNQTQKPKCLPLKFIIWIHLTEF